MKALFVNGSPRKNWNTHKMLDSAMQGAQSAGAETKIIHLYDYAFKGCVSCFACKLKNNKTAGLCAYRDDLKPVLEEALQSDVIVIGSPIYYSYPTGLTRAFMERLLFPVMTYSNKDNGERLCNVEKKIYSAMIYTMNCTEELAPKVHYPEILEPNAFAMRLIFGYCETLCAYDTYQFKDYSRYEANVFDAKEKAERLEKTFPQDLQKAFELGARLVEKAKSPR